MRLTCSSWKQVAVPSWLDAKRARLRVFETRRTLALSNPPNQDDKHTSQRSQIKRHIQTYPTHSLNCILLAHTRDGSRDDDDETAAAVALDSLRLRLFWHVDATDFGSRHATRTRTWSSVQRRWTVYDFLVERHDRRELCPKWGPSLKVFDAFSSLLLADLGLVRDRSHVWFKHSDDCSHARRRRHVSHTDMAVLEQS